MKAKAPVLPKEEESGPSGPLSDALRNTSGLVDTDIGTIAGNWKVSKLEDLCENPQYGYTASAAATGNARFLRISDITESGVKWATVPFCKCPEESIKRYLLKSGDIVFARIVRRPARATSSAIRHDPFSLPI